MGVVGPPDRLPGLAVVLDMAAPAQGLETDRDVVGPGELAEFVEVGRDPPDGLPVERGSVTHHRQVRLPPRGARLAGWELLENSQWVIDRYREATMALGYNGDSVINSLADMIWMIVGFGIARRLPVWATVAIALAFEILTLAVIRDNLALNVLMLVAPVETISNWQAAG